MFARCVKAGACHAREYSPYLWGVKSNTRDDYFTNPAYADYPVIMLEGGDAAAYCEWVGRRLPGGLEWEKAARGTDGRTYPWGEGIDCERANYGTCSKDTAPADSYPAGASPYGVLNMAGNLQEWTAEWYDPRDGSPMTETQAQAYDGPVYRTLRGGAWGLYDRDARTTARANGEPEHYFDGKLGFRCAANAQ